MTIPQGRDAHVDQYLTQVVLDYTPFGFIADDVLPVVRVAKQSDAILEVDQEDLFRREITRRARDTEANRVKFATSSHKYYAENYALAEGIAMEDLANADAAFNILNRAENVARRLRGLLELDREVRLAGDITGGVGSSSNVASAWSDLTNSDPLGDIWTGMDNVEDSTGYRPNQVAFSSLGWRYFRRNDTVISKVHNTGVSGGGLSINMQQAAELLGVERVHVGGLQYNTADEAQALSLSRAWGDDVVIYFAPLRPSMELPSFGYQFLWEPEGRPAFAAERHPFDPRRKSQTIEVGYYMDEVITSARFGFGIDGVGSST